MNSAKKALDICNEPIWSTYVFPITNLECAELVKNNDKCNKDGYFT